MPRNGLQYCHVGSLFSFTPDEQAGIRKLLDQCPEPTAVLKARVASIVDRLLPGLQGLTMTEAQVDQILAGLVDRIVANTVAGPERWGKEEDLRATVINLLPRHFVAEAQGEIIHRLLAPPRN